MDNGSFILALSLVAIVSGAIGYVIGELGGGGLSKLISNYFNRVIDGSYNELGATITEQIDILQKDLHLTAVDMNMYAKEYLGRTLKEEITQYRLALRSTRQVAIDSIKSQQSEIDQQNDKLKNQYDALLEDIRKTAIDNISKTQIKVEQQNELAREQLIKHFEQEKKRRIDKFQENMTDIVSGYINEAIGNKINLSDQLPLILSDLKMSKAAMIEDITNGA